MRGPGHYDLRLLVLLGTVFKSPHKIKTVFFFFHFLKETYRAIRSIQFGSYLRKQLSRAVQPPAAFWQPLGSLLAASWQPPGSPRCATALYTVRKQLEIPDYVGNLRRASEVGKTNIIDWKSYYNNLV